MLPTAHSRRFLCSCAGVAPGTSAKSNPHALATLRSNTIFTNVAIKPDGDVWWEGLTDSPPPTLISWLRTDRFLDSGFDAAHPNSRFTAPAHQCPVMDPAWESKEGVPISAIIFGGRRSTTVPLVYEAKDWQHGVFVGASMSSETTAAAAGKRGILRSDPFAMRPFCGYNMVSRPALLVAWAGSVRFLPHLIPLSPVLSSSVQADYFQHWLSMASRTDPSKLPRVFHVNWSAMHPLPTGAALPCPLLTPVPISHPLCVRFRKNKSGKFLWPGFGENIRVLDWILRRCEEGGGGDIAVESEIGLLPKPGALNVEGLGLGAGVMEELSAVDAQEWLGDVKRTREFLSGFGERLPEAIATQLDELQGRFEAGAEQQIREFKAAE